uniref:Uncharacterized protein n=1 Tax=Anopheles coluzzii TaxID=1518534 RepID=A0A8W7Q570_ANOCL
MKKNKTVNSFNQSGIRQATIRSHPFCVPARCHIAEYHFMFYILGIFFGGLLNLPFNLDGTITINNPTTQTEIPFLKTRKEGKKSKHPYGEAFLSIKARTFQHCCRDISTDKKLINQPGMCVAVLMVRRSVVLSREMELLNACSSSFFGYLTAEQA